MPCRPKLLEPGEVTVIGESVIVMLPEGCLTTSEMFKPRFRLSLGILLEHDEDGEPITELVLMNGPRDNMGPAFSERTVDWEDRLTEDLKMRILQHRSRTRDLVFPIDLSDAVFSSGSKAFSEYEKAGKIWLAHLIAKYYRFRAELTAIGDLKYCIELSVHEESDIEELGSFMFYYDPRLEENLEFTDADLDGYFGFTLVDDDTEDEDED